MPIQSHLQESHAAISGRSTARLCRLRRPQPPSLIFSGAGGCEHDSVAEQPHRRLQKRSSQRDHLQGPINAVDEYKKAFAAEQLFKRQNKPLWLCEVFAVGDVMAIEAAEYTFADITITIRKAVLLRTAKRRQQIGTEHQQRVRVVTSRTNQPTGGHRRIF